MVVDEDVVEFVGGGHFLAGGGETTLEVGFSGGVVGGGATAQAGFEGGEVGSGEEDEDGAGHFATEGARALDVGADDDGAAGGDEIADLIAGDAAAVAVDVGVFEEAVAGEKVVEFGVGEEEVMDAVGLTGTSRAGSWR